MFWVSRPNFLTLVKDIWIASTLRNALAKVMVKLKHVKLALRDLNKVHFGSLNVKIKQARSNLEKI